MRVEWTEPREYEPFRIIADQTANGWEFSEKSCWEVRWYPMESTASLVAKANVLAAAALKAAA